MVFTILSIQELAFFVTYFVFIICICKTSGNIDILLPATDTEIEESPQNMRNLLRVLETVKGDEIFAL